MRRSASLVVALAAFALLGAAFSACYDLPRPVCGFQCGPSMACPEDYTCDPSDGRCHLNGAPPTVCVTTDAFVLPDSAIDASDAMPDASDAMPDASDASDAMLDASDAMLDASDDAMLDASVDAMLGDAALDAP